MANVICNIHEPGIPALVPALKWPTEVLEHPIFVSNFSSPRGFEALELLYDLEYTSDNIIAVLDSPESMARLHQVVRCTHALHIPLPNLRSIKDLRSTSSELFARAYTPFLNSRPHVVRDGDLTLTRLTSPYALVIHAAEDLVQQVADGTAMVYAATRRGEPLPTLRYRRAEGRSWDLVGGLTDMASLMLADLLEGACALAQYLNGERT